MYKRITYVLCMLISGTILFSQEFNALQKEIIAAKTNDMLQEYNSYGGLSEDGKSISVLFLNKFSNLFTNTTSVYIYNDMDPDKTLPEYITVGEYILKTQTWYKTGLDIKLNWNLALISEPVLTGPNNIYSVSIIVEKQLMGVYQGKKIHKASSSLYFIVEFKRNKNEFSGFKIAGIQKERPNLKPYDEDDVTMVAKKSKVSLLIFSEPRYSRIYSKMMFTDKSWKVSGKISYSAGMGLSIRMKKDMDFITGLGISKFSSAMSLSYFNRNTNTNPLYDKDNDLYYRYIEAENINERCGLTYIEIPAGLGFHKTPDFKIGCYLQAGINIQFLITGRYRVTGYSSHTGYYPDYHVLLFDLPEYDFTTGNIDKDETWKVNPINITSFVKCGLILKLSKSSSFQLGPVLNYGITDLKYKEPKHRDDYYSTIGPPGKSIVQSLGFNLAVAFKL